MEKFGQLFYKPIEIQNYSKRFSISPAMVVEQLRIIMGVVLFAVHCLFPLNNVINQNIINLLVTMEPAYTNNEIDSKKIT